MKKCKHQFFETNKAEHTESCTCYKSEPIKIVVGDPISSTPLHWHLPSKYGVQIVCGLCGERRQVWQDGSINIYNRKKELWEDMKKPVIDKHSKK